MVFAQLTQAVGGAALLYVCYKIGLLVYLYNRPSSLSRYLHDGSYAVVTGSSDGIGLGFAEELLARGFNVILHGRNREKLERIQRDLANQHQNRAIAIAVADASRSDGDIHIISDVCKGKNVTVLIHNVGGAFTVPKLIQLSDSTTSQVDDGINLNVRFPVQLTRALLPSMAEDGPSLIMSLGSIGGPLGMPLASIYSGSKCFNLAWSTSMKQEMEFAKTPVDFLGIQLALVKTGVDPDRPVNFFIPTARQFAAAALDRVGCGRRVVWPWWPHLVVDLLMTITPDTLLDMMMVATIRQESAKEQARMLK